MKKLLILHVLFISGILSAQCDLDLSHTYSSSATCTGGDGSATVYPQSGSGNYTYSWIPSGNTQTNNMLNPGVYQVTVTDNVTMCEESISVEVFDGCTPGAPTCVVTKAIDTLVCSGYNFTYLDGTTSTNITIDESHVSTLNGQGIGVCDSIITEYISVLPNSSGIDAINACGSYIWIDGNTYTATNNTATFILANQIGCDSIITLDLTIDPLPDINTTQNASQLTAVLSGAAYQWLDCDDNYSMINGETNQSYTPPITGNYAVEVNMNGCVDTSACFMVDYTGIEELLQTEKELVKVIDFMGRETEYKPDTPLIFIYSDGTRERVMKIEK